MNGLFPKLIFVLTCAHHFGYDSKCHIHQGLYPQHSDACDRLLPAQGLHTGWQKVCFDHGPITTSRNPVWCYVSSASDMECLDKSKLI